MLGNGKGGRGVTAIHCRGSEPSLLRFRKAGVAWKRVDSKMLNGDDSRSSYRQSTPDFGKVVEIDIGGKDGFVSEV